MVPVSEAFCQARFAPRAWAASTAGAGSLGSSWSVGGRTLGGGVHEDAGKPLRRREKRRPAFLLQTLLDNSAVIDFLAAVQPAVIEGSAPQRLLRDRYNVASEDVEPQPEPE